ncbi:hypothetical protein MUY27_08835 [Mucilaginibacter sp. RS28]|uniref:Uncharacterized protein n=1 Tax=Mucilaginibacter straminoryzae TaxID=2932774 RepID=A0A9X1X227_9SPHI|nr:hypothetical protein [Mucilaginibacter straminoryzae]MCJ8209812.1 hypothetical protein [Mucilaginibacter straminoryzae]
MIINHDAQSASRTFSTLADFEKFLQSRTKENLEDSIVFRSPKSIHSNSTKKANEVIEDNSTSDEFATHWNDPQHTYTYKFEQFKERGYASLVLCDISFTDFYNLDFFTLTVDGSMAGSYSYNTSSIIGAKGTARTLNATVNGFYQEVVSVGGAYSFYTNYLSKFTLTMDRTVFYDMKAKLTFTKIN